MDIFSSITVAGIPLVLIIMGLVEWVKGFGVEGQALRGVSLAVGLALGVGYQLSVAVPVDFAGWFAAVVFGLGLGLVASGLFDAAKSARQ